MLKLIRTRKLSADAIPAHLTTLSVSWLNGQFKAVAVERGVVQGTWEYPGEAEEAEQFGELLREAIARTNYAGRMVSLVLAHPRLAQQLVDLPPVKGPAVQKIIRRQAQQQKLFAGEAAWACQTSLSAKGTQRVILHLFPKPLLDQLIQGCQRSGLDLIAVVPASAVLHGQLMHLPMEAEEVGLLAADTGGSTTVVIGRKDGQLLLVRTLSNTWNGSIERLAVDLNRTMLFISQQCGATVSEGVWLFGPGAQSQAQALQGQMQLPVSVSPVEYQPFAWATSALTLDPRRTPNFLSPELRRAPRRRVYARVVVASAALLLLGAVVASAFSLWAARQETANLEHLRQTFAQLEKRRQQLQLRNTDFFQQQQLIDLVLERRPSPVPMWVLGYLSEVVPPELAVTNLHLQRVGDSWKLRMTTASQGSASGQASVPPEVASAVVQLRTKLSDGPFRMAPLSGIENEASRPASSASRSAMVNALLIEGVVR
jgi:hypothetical protein